MLAPWTPQRSSTWISKSRGGTDLEPLVAELSSALFELRVVRGRGRVLAVYETPGVTESLAATRRALIRVVSRLSPPARRAWVRARRRDFDVGIQAGSGPRSLALAIDAAQVAQVARLGARIVITVYAAPPPPRQRAVGSSTRARAARR